MKKKYPDQNDTRDEMEILRNLDGEGVIRRFEADHRMLWEFFLEQCRERLFEGLQPFKRFNKQK